MLLTKDTKLVVLLISIAKSEICTYPRVFSIAPFESPEWKYAVNFNDLSFDLLTVCRQRKGIDCVNACETRAHVLPSINA